MRKNNLIIKFSKTYDKYQVIAPEPNKRVLEAFDTLEQAMDFADRTMDFVKNRKRRELIK